MKVKLKYNYCWEEKGCSPALFNKDEEYRVVHEFAHEDYGVTNHIVYVILSKSGESMSVSAEVVVVCENEVER